jgi:transcriptional regulator with XRE-family HTH domain
VDQARVEQLAEQMRQQVRAYRLREIRTSQDMTQVQLAEQLDVSQNRISRLESGDIGRSHVDTLRKYVEALGGRLKIEAAFGDTSYVISG